MNEPLRVYVAGAVVERHERAIPAMQALRAAGITITHDWTESIVDVGSAERSEADVPEDIRYRAALDDASGVRAADVVLLLAPSERGSSGAWVELGLAIGFGVPVLAAGPKNGRTIFTSLTQQRFPTDDEAIAHLIAMQRERTRAA
jgi:hypothetical protein